MRACSAISASKTMVATRLFNVPPYICAVASPCSNFYKPQVEKFDYSRRLEIQMFNFVEVGAVAAAFLLFAVHLGLLISPIIRAYLGAL